MEPSVKVVVDGIGGRLCDFQIGAQARLGLLRLHIYREVQWQPVEQRLLLNGKVLYDDGVTVRDLISDSSGSGESATLQLSIVRRDWEEAALILKLGSELCVPVQLFLTASADLRGRKDIAMTLVLIDGCLLQYIGDDMQRERDVVKAAVRQNGLALQYGGETFRDDPALVLEAVHQFHDAMEYASARLKCDKLFVRAAVARAGCCVAHVAPHLRRDKEIATAAIESQWKAYFKVDPALRGDKGFVLAAIAKAAECFHALRRIDGWAAVLRGASTGLRDDRDVVLAALKSSSAAMEFASDRLRADRDMVKAALVARDVGQVAMRTDSRPVSSRDNVSRPSVIGGSWCLRFVASELRSDREIMSLAADVDPMWALEFASPSLLKDKDFMTMAIRKGCSFTHLSWNLRDDEDVVMEVLSYWQTPSYVMEHWISERLRSSKEFVMEAVRIEPELFRIASEEIRGDWAVAIQAMRFAMPDLVLHVAEQLRENREFAFRAIDIKVECFQYLPEKIRCDREIALAAVKGFGNNLKYVSTQLRDDNGVVAAAAADCSHSISYASTRIQLERERALGQVGRALWRRISEAKRRRLLCDGGRYA